MSAHYLGEGWSHLNKIPTVQEYMEKKEARDEIVQSQSQNDNVDAWWNWASASTDQQNGMQPSPPHSLQHTESVTSHMSQNSAGGNDDPHAYMFARPVASSGRLAPPEDTSSDGHDVFSDSMQSPNEAAEFDMEDMRNDNSFEQSPMKTRKHRSFNPLRRKSSRRPNRSQQNLSQAGADEGERMGDNTGDGSNESQGSDKTRSHQKILNAGGGEQEKDRIKKAAKQSKEPKKNNFVAKGQRVVEDPVTGKDVVIQDGRDLKIDPTMLDSRYSSGFSTKRALRSDMYKSRNVNPDPARPTNVLLQRFPEPIDPGRIAELDELFNKLLMGFGAVLVLTWGVATVGNGWSTFVVRTFWLALAGLAGFMGFGLMRNRIYNQMERIRSSMTRQRGENCSPPYPESVEWVNAIIACVWRQLNPEMFVAALDQVEDIMQASLPSMVSSVKISDVGLGENPFRLIAMRGLADLMTENMEGSSSWIESGGDGLLSRNKNAQEGIDDQDTFNELDSELKQQEVEDTSGDFLNLEVSFCYSAKPGQSSKDRSKNIHLLVEFFIGAFDWLEIPIPVWVQVERIIGTARVRAQIMSEPPFVRNVTFSLMGVPKVSISAIPILRVLPNVLDLPIISSFVQASIAAASDMYVAPKSMTMNVRSILAGDGVKKDTDAIGVIVVNVHHGQDLSSQDVNGRSDPYCVLSLAKFGRPMYSTRIIFEDLNPVWEETAFLLITKEDVRSDEGLSLQLWDSDKRTADDIVGRVNVPLRELVRNPNQMKSHWSSLMGFEDADQMEGYLSWSVGFFDKTHLNKKLREKVKKDKPDDKVDEVVERKPSPIDSEQEALTLDTPPDPDYPCGILSVIVRFVAGLERRDVEKGVDDKEREGASGQDVEAGSSKLPCGYCELILNDNLFYKTRVKQYNNFPYFQAGSEIFVRDWTKSELRMIVRDSRLREHDPIMGIVSLPLQSLFKSSSQIEQSFALQDGVGYGKIACSIVFRSVKLQIPPELRGYSTVSVDLLSSIEIKGHTPEWVKKLDDVKITLVANKYEKKLGTRYKHHPENEEEPLVRVPVFDRYSTNLVFCFGRTPLTSTLPIPNFFRAVGLAILPLRELEDKQLTDVELPILAGPALHALERNFINSQTKKTHKFDEVGTLSVRVRVNPGFDDAHKQILVGSRDRHEFEVYERLVGLPNRAEMNSRLSEEEAMTRRKRRETSRLQTRELHMRHRGAMGYTPVRTAVWAKDGLVDHVNRLGRAVFGSMGQRDQSVNSEV